MEKIGGLKFYSEKRGVKIIWKKGVSKFIPKNKGFQNVGLF